MSPAPKTSLCFLLLTCLYVAGGWTATAFIVEPDQVALIWPPAGLSLAALLVFGLRWWPFIAVGALSLHLLLVPVPLLFLPYSLAANVLAAVAGAWVVLRLEPEVLAGLSIRLGLHLMLGALVACAVSALIGVPGMIHAGMAGSELFWGNLVTWALSDLFGSIAIVPAFLLLTWRVAARSGSRRRYATGSELLVWLLALAAAIVVLLWASSGSPGYALGLAVLPLSLLMWSALRFAPLVTAVATGAMALFVAAVTGLGIAGFSAPSGPLDASLLLSFLCVTATVPQMLAAATHVNRIAAEQLLHRARSDELTGLPNRSAFEEQARAANSSNEQLALAYLDLDQFKLINDTLSHAAGDQLIRELAGVLGSCLRPGDCLARIGGDEFGVLLRRVDSHEALHVAEHLREAVAALRFPWKQRVITPTTSIGIVCYRAGTREFPDLLTAADSACFLAKELGGNRVEEGHGDAATVHERSAAMQWALRIGEAIDANSFELHAQSIVALHDNADPALRLEVLLRMRDSDNGKLLLPAQFVSAAERFGLAARLDRHVVSRVLGALEERPDALQGLASCSINLSAATLMDDGFPDFLSRRLKSSPVPARMLCFEITETSAIRDLKRAQDFIAGVRALGCSFALDDFGTGFCSFAYLQHLHVDSFKIDGTFVREAHRSPLALAIVRAIIEIARVLKRKTVAECVENEAHWRQMKALGADFAQGFHLDRPQPLAAWLDRVLPARSASG